MRRLLPLLFLIAGCASYKATLVNEKGQTVTCEASGKNGLLTGGYVRGAFDDCMASAKAQGFAQAKP